jgi:two-component system OmpR family response regulator
MDTQNSIVSPHILVVDDDPAMRRLVTDYLAKNGVRVTAVGTGAEMAGVLCDSVVDVVVLDLRLHNEDGLRLAMKLREKSEIPIIMLSGETDEADRIMSLELAADDCLAKPFSPRELLARLRAVLRRYQTRNATISMGDEKRRAYRFLGWEMNLCTRRLTTPNGRRVGLSNGQFNLLRAFCAAPRRVLSREQLLGLSRLHGDEVYDRSIDVQILRLRRKIEPNPSEPQFILTERGAGYCFDAPVEVLQ